MLNKINSGRVLLSVSLGCVLLLVDSGLAQVAAVPAQPAKRNITIQGRKEVLINSGAIRLGDIAEIYSERSQDDEAIIGLKKMQIQNSPAPGQSQVLEARQVLDSLKAQGVNLQEVGYVFPREINIKRASRSLAESEIRSVIEDFIGANSREVNVKRIEYPKDLQIFPGEIEVKAVPLNKTRSGHLDFDMSISAPGEQSLHFAASAVVDEWREVPVASRTLTRGAVVGTPDVIMARLNLAALPKDIATSAEGVIGLKVAEDLGEGEVFRSNKLAVPAIIEAGSRVSMIYREGRLEATASGTAMESAAQGQPIKVRNDNSKKVVIGTAIEPGMVEVRP
jgi:flagella basal body P-ring formation protein FlgA